MYNMSVNSERNVAGDLLVHVAVKGGLLLLPLLFVLIHHFRADVSLRNSEGLTPLCLAAKLGESKIAEVGTPPSHRHTLTVTSSHCHTHTHIVRSIITCLTHSPLYSTLSHPHTITHTVTPSHPHTLTLSQILVCVFGADINECDDTRLWTPLHYAVQFNHPEVVR